MMALDPKALESKLKAIFKKKKRDPELVGTGTNLRPPTFYINAPKPIRKLMGVHYPGRRVIEIAGKPNSGKTTLGMLAMIDAQKGYYDKDFKYIEEPINIILVDTEGKFSVTRFIKMGGNPEKLFKIGALTLEDAFFGLEETLNLIYTEEPDAKTLIVFDSLGGTPSLAEADAAADEKIQLATAAKVIKRNLRVMVPRWIDKHDIALMIINTNYANIGSVGRSNSGGDGAEFASAIIMQLSRVADITFDQGGQKMLKGIKSVARITKNHMQTDEYALKEINFEIYAYDIKTADKFTIKKGATFINDDGRLVVDKAQRKDKVAVYHLELDDKEDETNGVATSATYEALLKRLEDDNYDTLLEG